jgi:predicted  nucleic acid-binding Zn-ribbon protein
MSDEALLEIQQFDVDTDRLIHRRLNMEQRNALEEARVERAKQQVEIDAVAASRVEVANRQRRFEDEAQIVSDKADTDDARLYSGEVQGVKDLEALQHEIGSLRARQENLEDQALEAMEEAEDLRGRVESLEAERLEVDTRIDRLESEITTTEAEIDSEIDRISAARAAAVGSTDPDLVKRYEQLHPGMGSATVVRFDGSNCSGCPSVMPAMEVDRVKHEPAGSTLECRECGRIVLR